MSLNLQKKGKLNLTKPNPGLSDIFAGLGWDMANPGSKTVDCDVSVFMLGENGKVPQDEYLVFYNNVVSPDNAVRHSGDNRTGAGEGDDEVIEIQLSAVNPSVNQIIFCVTIHEAESLNQSFGDIQNAFIRIVNKAKNEELCRYTLDEQFSNADSVIIGRMYRLGSDWEFEAMGSPFSGGLEKLVELYVY